MSDDRQEAKAIERAVLRRWQPIYVAAIMLVSLPYAISFTSQLCSDDFILLYNYGTRPLGKIWTVFSPRTIWTYHPLQHSYFVLGWHLSGIEPWAYRAMSLAVHLGTALLLMQFGRALSGSIHVGGCAAIAFAGSWRHWEAIAWAASIATPESTFFAILSCVAFWRYLRGRRCAAYALLILACVGWFFSKETIIQLPLFLIAIYLYWRWSTLECGGSTPPSNSNKALNAKQMPADEEKRQSGVVPPHSKMLPDLARFLAAPTAIVVTYLIFYALFVRNVYTFGNLGYVRVPFGDWPSNVMWWLDVALNPLLDNNVVDVLVGDGLMFFLWRWHVVSVAVVLLALVFALVYRRMLPLLAMAMALVAMIPYAALLVPYQCSRYHYEMMLGGSLLIIALGREFWRLATGKRGGRHSALRIVVAATGGLWVVANFAQLANTALHDRTANRVPRELYDFFASQTDKADRPVLFVVDTEPMSHAVDVELGWGLVECARLALRSDTVAAAELGYDLEPSVLREFNDYPEKYLVLRKETGWETSRLPNEVRLAFPSNGQGGVTLDKGS